MLLAASLAAPACRAPYPSAILLTDGSELRLTLVESIRNDPDLNEDEKKQALRDLGVTDEEILNILVRP